MKMSINPTFLGQLWPTLISNHAGTIHSHPVIRSMSFSFSSSARIRGALARSWTIWGSTMRSGKVYHVLWTMYNHVRPWTPRSTHSKLQVVGGILSGCGFSLKNVGNKTQSPTVYHDVSKIKPAFFHAHPLFFRHNWLVTLVRQSPYVPIQWVIPWIRWL